MIRGKENGSKRKLSQQPTDSHFIIGASEIQRASRELENKNRLITSLEIKTVTKKIFQKAQGQMSSHANSTKILEES